MGFGSYWFITDETNAESLATSGPGSLSEDPHLALENVSEPQLAGLWCILLGEPPLTDRFVAAKVLYAGGNTDPFVTVVKPAFLDALAEIRNEQVPAYAAAWAAADD